MILYFRKFNYIFFGSPKFAEIILKKLIDAGMPPAAVICNPDRPFGRKKVLAPPPVKQLIINLRTPDTGHPTLPVVLQPEKLDENFRRQLLALKPDFAVVAAYANILPKEVIAVPRLGTIGVHPSLLPKYRGATPIQSAILAGETETGTTLFLIDERVDHGAILAYRKSHIANSDTYETLLEQLAHASGDLLIETLPRFVAGEIMPQAQDESAASYTKKFTTEDGFVDMRKDAPELIWRKVRALNPNPGVYTFSEKNGKKIRTKLLDAELRDGKLIPTLIQYEGKKPQYIDSMNIRI